jgi:plasmid stabilization system protein ParE
MALKWSPAALDDIERLVAFLDHHSVAAGNQAAELILQAARRLLQTPNIGRPLDNSEMRDWFAPFGASAYVLRYRIDSKNDVFIIRVWHSREDRP